MAIRASKARRSLPEPANGAPGAGAAQAFARARELYPTWRLTSEQRDLRDAVRAQQAVGRRLAELERAGAHVLHARKAPGGALELHHVVFTAGGILLLHDIVCSRRSPAGIDSDGALTRGGHRMDRLQLLLRQAAIDVASHCAEQVPEGWTVPVVPAIVLVGDAGGLRASVNGEVAIVRERELIRWAATTLPPTMEPVQLALLVETALV